jgi:hypothetical protein
LPQHTDHQNDLTKGLTASAVISRPDPGQGHTLGAFIGEEALENGDAVGL